MATLNTLAQEVKKKLGLTLGVHKILFTTGAVSGDTITINGIKMTGHSLAGSNTFVYTHSGSASTLANNFKTAFDNVFIAGEQGMTCSLEALINTVTITGAGTVVPSNKVGSSVSIEDAEMEPPTQTDILGWLKEGQLDIANKIIDQALISEGSSMITEDTAIETSGKTLALDDLPSDFLRPIVFRYKTTVAGDVLNRAEKVPYDLLVDIRDRRHPFYLTGKNPEDGNKWYSLFAGNIQLGENTDTAIDASMVYVKKPQTLHNTECDLPESLQKLAVDYACAKSLNSIGKEAEGQAYLQQYVFDIQGFNMRYMPEEKNEHEVKQSKVAQQVTK